MVSKLKFLGVAAATWARVAAKVATWAKAVANTATKFTAARAESLATAAILAKSAKKFTALTATALIAFSLSACGGGSSEEKETRTPSSNDKAAASENGWDLAMPKSYVREKKADTLPPFIVLMGNDIAGSSFGFDKNGDEILNIKATNKSGEDCRAGYQGDESGGFGGLRECGPNEVATIEVTTKSSGKVTYKF